MYFRATKTNPVNPAFYNQIANSTAHRPIRDLLSGKVLNDKTLLPDLLAIAFDIKDKNHHKACWILELVFETKTDWLAPHLDAFCKTLPHFTNESAMRPIAKIGLFASEYYQKHPGFLHPLHIEQIMETCFDRLINPVTKVATKAYSMRTLYELGKKEDWVYPELIRILSEDSAKHTAAYKAAAKDILKRIKKFEFMQGL